MISNLRLQKSVRSMQALEKLLINVAFDPRPYADDKELRYALRSQGSLAKFHSEKLGIQTSSLNTLKRVANSALVGKFAIFDEKRLKALDALKEAASTTPLEKKTRQKILEERLLKSNSALQTALQDNWLLTQALDRSLKQGRYYATQADKPRILALYSGS